MLEGKPLIVCLCGSTRLMKTAFVDANRDETLKGYIVLSVGVDMKDETQAFLQGKNEAQKEIIKQKLDWLHRRKIDLADVVIFLKDSQGYGDSTKLELEYAKRKGKVIEEREV